LRTNAEAMRTANTGVLCIWFNKVWQTLFPIRYALGIQRSESRDPGTNLQTKYPTKEYSCFSGNMSNGKWKIVHAHIIPEFQHYLVRTRKPVNLLQSSEMCVKCLYLILFKCISEGYD